MIQNEKPPIKAITSKVLITKFTFVFMQFYSVALNTQFTRVDASIIYNTYTSSNNNYFCSKFMIQVKKSPKKAIISKELITKFTFDLMQFYSEAFNTELTRVNTSIIIVTSKNNYLCSKFMNQVEKSPKKAITYL